MSSERLPAEPAMSDPGRPRGNYFSEAAYLTADPRTGVLRTRAGTRTVALTDHFLRGVTAAITTACGPAADAALKACGREWGRRFAARFAAEVGVFYGEPLPDASLGRVAGTLAAAVAHQGWGRLTLDFGRPEVGLIVATLDHPVGAAVAGAADRPADALFAGVLAGVVTHVAGRDLDCIQTQCAAAGHPASKFVVGVAGRLAPFADAAAGGQSHDRIVRKLTGEA